MRHGELMTIIDQMELYGWSAWADMQMIDAIRQIAEIHKPRQDPASTCAGCSLTTLYPCPTIQILEKELG